VLSVLTLLPVLLHPPVWAQIPADRPTERLAQAEALAARGKWKSARDKYWNIRRNFPGTPEAEVSDRRLKSGLLGWRELEIRGPSENRVDVVVTGDAFELMELGSLQRLAGDVVTAFDRNPTLKEYEQCFNFHLLAVYSRESGVAGLGKDRFDNAFGARTSGRNKTHVTVDQARVKQVMAEMPHQDGQAIVIVDKPGLSGTGGGGVATVAGRPDKNTVLHEFGHSFASLADEYSSDVGYTGNPSDSANLATTNDPKSVPWRHFLDSKVYRKVIGIHRGGGGRATGTWKPTVRGCLMVGSGDYCPVCREQMILTLYRYVDPIDAFTPSVEAELDSALGKPIKFSVTPIAPKTHDLEVKWYLLPGDQRQPSDPRRTRRNGRLKKLEPIPEEPIAVTRDTNGVHRFKYFPDKHGVGPVTLVCRVVDPAVVKGKPWVLKDDHGLLQSEQRWVIW